MCLTLYCKNFLNSSKDRPCLMLAKRFISLAPESKRNISYPYNPAIVWSVDHILAVFVDFISSQNLLIHPIFPSLPSYFYSSQDFMVSISTSLFLEMSLMSTLQ